MQNHPPAVEQLLLGLLLALEACDALPIDCDEQGVERYCVEHDCELDELLLDDATHWRYMLNHILTSLECQLRLGDLSPAVGKLYRRTRHGATWLEADPQAMAQFVLDATCRHGLAACPECGCAAAEADEALTVG